MQNDLYGVTEQSYQKIADVLQKNSRIQKAIVFGSRALGAAKAGSDIDLALIGDGSLLQESFDVAGQLNETTPIPYTVDVLDYATITNQELKDHIDRVGKVFWSRN